MVAFFHKLISIGRCCDVSSSQPVTVNASCRQYLHYIKTGTALWRRVPCRVSQGYRIILSGRCSGGRSTVDRLIARMDRRWDCFKRCVGMERMF